MSTQGSRTIGTDVEELYFGRGVDNGHGCRLSMRVSHDDVAPVLMVGAGATWLTPDQARDLADALYIAASRS